MPLGSGGFTTIKGFGVQKADLCLGNKLVSWRPDFSSALDQFCTVVTHHGFTLEGWTWGKLLAVALRFLRIFAALRGVFSGYITIFWCSYLGVQLRHSISFPRRGKYRRNNLIYRWSLFFWICILSLLELLRLNALLPVRWAKVTEPQLWGYMHYLSSHQSPFPCSPPVLGALNLYWCICTPWPHSMGLKTKFCPWCYMWAHCKPEFLLALLAESKGSVQPAKRHYEPSSKFRSCFSSPRKTCSMGRHGSCKISLPFGWDYNNKMSESPHGTLIWSNCLQENQAMHFSEKLGGMKMKKTIYFHSFG